MWFLPVGNIRSAPLPAPGPGIVFRNDTIRYATANESPNRSHPPHYLIKISHITPLSMAASHPQPCRPAPTERPMAALVMNLQFTG